MCRQHNNNNMLHSMSQIPRIASGTILRRSGLLPPSRSFSLALDLDHKMVDNVPGTFQIQTFNAISPVGLSKFSNR